MERRRGGVMKGINQLEEKGDRKQYMYYTTKIRKPATDYEICQKLEFLHHQWRSIMIL